VVADSTVAAAVVVDSMAAAVVVGPTVAADAVNAQHISLHEEFRGLANPAGPRFCLYTA
jgi:hypothetical protein